MAETGISSNETSRIVYRNTDTVFKADFFHDAAQVVPIIPQDPTQYPAYNIITPSGAIEQSGVATLDVSAGHYRINWHVDSDVELSNAESRWRVEWIMISNNNRQIPFVFEFDVADRIVSTVDSMELEFNALEGKPFTVRIPLTVQPYALTITVSDSNDSSTIILSGTLAGSDISMAPNGDQYIYYIEIPTNTLEGNRSYTAVWEIQDTVGSITDHVFQVIRTIPHTLLQYLPNLRTLIDRIQKRLTWIQAYQDSHLVNFLYNGLNLVNNHHPYTTYGYMDLPLPLKTYWLLYSGWYALQSQGLLENDIGFSYSGQEITLEYDRASGIGESLGRMLDYINGDAGTGGLTNAKTAIVRRARGVGSFAGRPVRISSAYNLVYRLATYSSTDFMGLLVQFGLI